MKTVKTISEIQVGAASLCREIVVLTASNGMSSLAVSVKLGKRASLYFHQLWSLALQPGTIPTVCEDETRVSLSISVS